MLTWLVQRFDLKGSTGVYSSLLNKLYDRRVFFAHIPKSGGTSLSHLLRAKYPLSFFKVSEEKSQLTYDFSTQSDWMHYKQGLVAYHAQTGAHFLQGHVPVNEDFIQRNLRGFKLVTLLRHPVERAISSYFFDPRLRTIPIEEYLGSRQAFVETHVLCHFFGSLHWDNPENVETAIERAKKTLNRFDVVGRLDEPEAFRNQLAKHIGLRVPMPKRNVGENRDDAVFTPEVRAKLARLCAADLEIYDSFLPLRD